MTKLRVLSLFAGIGGFDLGLERTGGFETVAFCEIDPFCRRVLAKHWPEVKQYGDVRELTADQLRADGIVPDVICGGFPCQDVSNAKVWGSRDGLEGSRSGLWSEFRRLIGEVRPSFVFVENVSALLGRGLAAVLGDLAALGYDAEWHCIPASAVGAPHYRDRFWLVAYANSTGLRGGGRRSAACPTSQAGGEAGQQRVWPDAEQCSYDLADAGQQRLEGRSVTQNHQPEIGGEFPWGSLAGISGQSHRQGSWWQAEPNVGRVAHGVPSRVDRLRALGNAVVPQIPELIGNAILALLAEQRRAA